MENNKNIDINNTIVFDIDGEKKEVEILEQTIIDNVTYLLVCEKDIEEGECYIIKDISKIDDEESIFVAVDDELELNNAFKVFKNILKDEDISLNS